MLEHANADQINAVSEMVLNLLRNRIPIHPITMAKLHCYKTTRFKGGVPSMSMLNTRDAHSYPLQGYDKCGPSPPLKEVVAKSNAKETQGNDTLTRLIQLLQAAHAREDKLNEETEFSNGKYNSLY